MLFKSSYPDIQGILTRNNGPVPADVTLWQWLFHPSPRSPPAAAAAAACAARPSSETGRRAAAAAAAFINANTGTRLTHAQARDAAAALSTALVRRLGLRAGDVVSVMAPNSVLYPVCTLAVVRAGGVPALSSPAYNADETAHVLRTVRSRFVVCSPDALPVVRAAARRTGVAAERIIVLEGDVGEGETESGGGEEGFVSVKELLEDGRKQEEMAPVVGLPSGKTSGEACAVLCFSSGTTGLPKAVMISHQNLIAQALQLIPTTSPDHKTVLGVLPLYHVTGVVRMQVLPFVINASVVMVPRFSMPALLSAISTHRIAEVQLVPPLLLRLVHDPLVDAYDLSCVRRFATGAAPVSDEVLRLLEARFPGTGFKQGYGMTESTACISTHPLDKYDYKYARTAGTLVASTVVKVVNADGVAVGVDERGEIRAKGPQIVTGYYNNPAATAEAFDAEGFLRTGDEGSISADGLLTIHDRIKEMIKVKGVQVAPAELEDLLLGHPKVADAAVIGVPDDYAGERPFAFAVLKHAVGGEAGRQRAAQEEEELVRFVRDAKSRTKWLAGVRIVEQIPKNPSGKILRRVLREEYKKEWAVPSPKL